MFVAWNMWCVCTLLNVVRLCVLLHVSKLLYNVNITVKSVKSLSYNLNKKFLFEENEKILSQSPNKAT